MSLETETVSDASQGVWQDHPEIPEGWKFQVEGETVKFLTLNGSVLDSAEQVVSYMEESKLSEESSFLDDEDEEKSEDNMEETVPEVWQAKESHIFSPDGVVSKTQGIALEEKEPFPVGRLIK